MDSYAVCKVLSPAVTHETVTMTRRKFMRRDFWDKLQRSSPLWQPICRQAGGLGAQPPVSKGRAGGNQDICLIGTMLVQKTSPSLNSYRRKPVRDRSRRFCYTGPTHVTGASRLIQQRPSSVVPLSRLLHPALAHCCTSLDRGTLFPHAIHTYDYPHPTTRAAPGGMYRL